MPGFGVSCPLLGATFPTTSTALGHCIITGEYSSLPAAPRKGYDGEEIRKGRDEEVVDSAAVAGRLKDCWLCLTGQRLVMAQWPNMAVHLLGYACNV